MAKLKDAPSEPEATILPQSVPEIKIGEKETPVVISDFIRKILRIYPDYEALYVDSKGCVYTPDTQPSIRGEAILYKNPFYSLKK